jgi:hypothetical protein
MMKHVLALTLVTLMACNTKMSKADLVDLQKIIKDSINEINAQIRGEEFRIRYNIQDSLSKIPNYSEDLEKIQIDMSTSFSGFAGNIAILRSRRELFQKKYDSLEFEIKKY